MKKALITGFQRFGNYAENPTEKACNVMDGLCLAEHKVEAPVFSNDLIIVNHGKTVVQLAKDINASVIISLGLSSSIPGFTLESRGYNEVNGIYAPEYQRGQLLAADGPAFVDIDWNKWIDYDEIKQKFEEEALPVNPNVSSDPGRYSCNGMIYNVVRAMQEEELTIPFMYMHVNCSKKAVENIADFDPKKILITVEQVINANKALLTSYK